MKPAMIARGAAWLAAGVFTVALGLTIWWPGDEVPDGPAAAAASSARGSVSVAGLPAVDAAPTGAGPAAPALPLLEPPPLAETTALPRFEADARGHLRLNAATHVGVERIAALFAPAQALAAIERQSAGLPAQAQRELSDLYHRQVQYAQAVAQALPPGAEAEPEQAWVQFEMLRSLRRQHFGEEAAQAMFGAEEQTAAALLQQMGVPRRP